MPQMKNSTSSVSGKKNSTSSVSGVENSTSLVSGDAGSNEHGGGIQSDGAVISSFLVNCRVVLLSLLVLAVGLVGGFLLSSKSKTKLPQQYMTLENDLSSVRTEMQLSENKIQLLEERVLTVENDMSSGRTEMQLLEQKVLTLSKQTLPCLKTVMYDTNLVTSWERNKEKKREKFEDENLYNLLGSKDRRDINYRHVKEITLHVIFFFIYVIDDTIESKDLPVLKKFFNFLSDSNFLNKSLTEKTIKQVSEPKNVLCLSLIGICKYPDVRKYQFAHNGGFHKGDMDTMITMAQIATMTGC